jgi:phosphoribosylaminoimidazole-succinocarboxamide synthase
MATTGTEGTLLYEGKAKKLFATDDPNLLVMRYKDDATAFDGTKHAVIAGKGALNNAISAIFFARLEAAGVPTHYVEKRSELECLVRRVSLFPLEVIVRNRVAGSMARRYGLEEGIVLAHPTVEFDLKSDPLHDPLVTEEQIVVLGWATADEVAEIRRLALKVNAVLSADLLARKVILVDFKLEFGRDPGGRIVVADEVSPDTCRFWDADSLEKLDKDRFRRDLGGLEAAYTEMLRRLGGEVAP